MMSDNTLSIRKATASDAKEISNLIISCLRETNAKDYSPDIIDRVVTNFTPEKVTALIESRDVFIATQNNLIIGTVNLDQSNIRSLFVLPEKQNCGIGAHLMQYVENIAKEQGCNLLTVPSSVTAEGFYKKIGYKTLRDEYYGTERTIIMEKRISELSNNNTVRLLQSRDKKVLEEYLEPHKSETMFICSNLKSAGIEYNGADFEGEYFGCFEGEHDDEQNLLGIIVHYWNGNIMMHASNNLVLERLTVHLKKNLNRNVAGVLGISDQASYVINALGLSDSIFSINRDEGLYDLCLLSLNTVNLSIDCNIVPAKEVSIDTLTQWMTDYEVEALGAIKNDALPERVNNKVERIRKSDCFALLQDNAPVSLVGFNSRLKDMLQIGPVWTPIEYRNKGFARRLLASALLKEKSHGIKKAILFTDNPAAIKAYEAIGFKEIGTYRLALLKDPITLPAQKNNVEVITTIETNRLILCRPEKRHNECLANLWRDKDVREYLGGVLSEKEIENKIILLHKHWKTHDFGFWVTLDKKSEQVVGLCGLSWEDGSLELSYMFFSQYWGQGIAQEAAKAALTHGFKKTGEKEIICITQKENTRSCKLLKKLGMKHVKDFERFNSVQSLFSIKHHLENDEMGKLL